MPVEEKVVQPLNTEVPASLTDQSSQSFNYALQTPFLSTIARLSKLTAQTPQVLPIVFFYVLCIIKIFQSHLV